MSLCYRLHELRVSALHARFSLLCLACGLRPRRFSLVDYLNILTCFNSMTGRPLSRTRAGASPTFGAQNLRARPRYA